MCIRDRTTQASLGHTRSEICLISLSFEKVLSPLSTVIGNVSKIVRATPTFGANPYSDVYKRQVLLSRSGGCFISSHSAVRCVVHNKLSLKLFLEHILIHLFIVIWNGKSRAHYLRIHLLFLHGTQLNSLLFLWIQAVLLL